ncbi:glycosyltransferase [Rheinheimera muenzenbergensis]|uniref:Glycosyltransferase n=1 Tax=Rheinheimera muenzenbergensis TaxID=1193628 RepID=A0ABU8CBF2_9GAMM
MSKHILYIAFHFPPIQISSGVHRSLAFSRYFAENGEHVTVLTADKKAYQHYDDKNENLVPSSVKVVHAFARDSARHFSIRKRYFGFLALPDRWQSWIFGAFFSGLKIILKQKQDVIISTYPIASAHIIGYLLHKITGTTWIADLRDPMLQKEYPESKANKKIFSWIERKLIKHCKHIILTSPGAVALYKERYPDVPSSVWQLFPNGYDEKLFSQAQANETHKNAKDICLVHSGTIYPLDRNPKHLFIAISKLKSEKPEIASRLHIVLRGSGHDHLFIPMIKECNIQDIVSLQPSLNYVEAINEMLSADALLLLQASSCNYQTPAKAYEYIRVQKPILALTDAEGDTADLIKQSNMAEIAPLNNSEMILESIIKLVYSIDNNCYQALPLEQIVKFSRQYQAEKLHNLILQL